MWESNVFECSVEEPPSKRGARSKSPLPTPTHVLKKMIMQHWSTSSDVASCNRRVVNGLIRFGVKSIMVARDETTLYLGATSSHKYEISI